jgi:hypothetical protein
MRRWQVKRSCEGRARAAPRNGKVTCGERDVTSVPRESSSQVKLWRPSMFEDLPGNPLWQALPFGDLPPIGLSSLTLEWLAG